MQWSFLLLILDIGGRAISEQQFCAFWEILRRSVVEGAAAEIVDGGRVGVSVQEKLEDVEVAEGGREDEGGAVCGGVGGFDGLTGVEKVGEEFGVVC